MKNILVPVDFSDLSKVAARYALALAEQLHCNLHLLSVQDLNTGPHALMGQYRLEEEMNNAAQEDGAALIKELRSLSTAKIEISFESQTGSPVYLVIDQYADAQQIDLIIMGSQGASGLKKVLLGSNAAAVINHSKVPVIVVPGQTVFKGIKSIVYATDIVHLDEELDQLASFVSDFGAQLHIIHAMPVGSTEEIDPEILQTKSIQTIPYATYHFHVFKSNPVAEAIDEFVKTHDADLLILFTHKLEFFEKLFDTSVTRLLAFHNHVPILSFNKTNRE